jgi:hypothetical protein
MLSDMTASPITASAAASAVPSTTSPARIVPLGRLAPITKAIKRVGNLLCDFAVASAWPVDACVEAQALLGLPIRTVFENQDYLWRRHREGDLYEPDPFAAESPFQRDMWPF